MENLHQQIDRHDPSAMADCPCARSARRPTNGARAVDSRRTSPTYILGTRFPVVRRLLGEQSFRAVAHRFALREPPHFPIPVGYGEDFPRFLRALGDAASIEYVADIAELEAARNKARHAAKAAPLGKHALRWCGPNASIGSRSRCTLRFAWCNRAFPIVTIWENNRHRAATEQHDRALEPRSRAGRAAVWRCRSPAPPAWRICLLSRLGPGQTVATAAHLAAAATPGFELAANLALLTDANVVVGLREAVGG